MEDLPTKTNKYWDTNLTRRLWALLIAIDEGWLKATPERSGDDIFAGDVTYNVENGWQIIVFADCPGWDYIDSFVTPEGERLELWAPHGEGSDPEAWEAQRPHHIMRNWEPTNRPESAVRWTWEQWR